MARFAGRLVSMLDTQGRLLCDSWITSIDNGHILVIPLRLKKPLARRKPPYRVGFDTCPDQGDLRFESCRNGKGEMVETTTSTLCSSSSFRSASWSS